MKKIFLSLIFLAFAGLAIQAQTPENLAHQDFHIIENLGQLADEHYQPRCEVPFYAVSDGVRLDFTEQGISQTFLKYQEIPAEIDEATGQPVQDGRPLRPGEKPQPRYRLTGAHSIGMTFLGANPHPQIVALQPNADYMNYYLPHCPDGLLGVQNYRKIVYKDLYPHIDMEVYSHGDWMKYDFVVYPGGDPSAIRVRYTGQQGLTIQPDGSLKLASPYGWMKEGKPIAYASGQEVRCGYQVKGGQVTFRVGVYDRGEVLRIDPAREWGTYYGGSGYDEIGSISSDASGYIYVAGSTSSKMNISTYPPVHQWQYSGDIDGFTTKFNGGGERIWSTYYGGDGGDTFYSMLLDTAQNSIYCIGGTYSTNNIASQDAHQSFFGGGLNDIMLVKFTSTGERVWGTYFGGSGADFLRSAELDNSGNIYIFGTTDSETGIASAGALNAVYGGGVNIIGGDAVIAKFNRNNGKRLWGTYFGGSSDDQITDISIDTSNNVYVGGFTYSNDRIATSQSFQENISGSSDAFLAKFDSSGTRLWGTYYGGTGYDNFSSLALDRQGYIFICGITGSDSGISFNSHQKDLGGGLDGMLVKFTGEGTRIWATYYGGIGNEAFDKLIVDDLNDCYLGGITTSETNIASASSHQSTYKGLQDVMIIKFSNNGVRLWGTYYGGTGQDLLLKMNFDNLNNLWFCGSTKSNTDIASQDAHQTIYGGGYDVMLVKMNSNNGFRLWGTYYGGGNNDFISSAIIKNSNNIYIGGRSESSSGIALGGYKDSYSDSTDAFLVKFGPCTSQACQDIALSNFFVLDPNITLPGTGANTPVDLQVVASNNGGMSSNSTYLKIWLSDDATLDSQQDSLLDIRPFGSLSSQQSVQQSFPVLIPDYKIPPGTYYIVLAVDPENVIEEADEANNLAIAQVNILSPYPTIINKDVPRFFIKGGTGAQKLSVKVNKPDKVTSLTLWTRSISDTVWSPITNLPGTGGEYSYELNDERVGAMGEKIGFMSYFEVKGPNTYVVRSDTSYTYTQINEKVLMPVVNGGTGVRDYRILSIPFELSNAKVDFQLASQVYDTAAWRLFHYADGLHEFKYDLDFPRNFAPGKGYWLISREDRGLEVKDGATTTQVTDSTPFEISLTAGWNQIGNPYRFNLSWPDILAANPQLEGQEQMLYVFGSGGFQTTNRLNAFEGAFIRSNSPQQIKIPILENKNVNRFSSPGIPLLRQPFEEGNWDVGIGLESGDLVQHIYGLGMRSDAFPDKDRYDFVSLPMFFDMPDLRFPHPGGELHLSKDVVTTDKSHVWEFDVRGDALSPYVTLTWDNSYWGRSGLQLYLFDVENQQPVNMSERSSYRFRGEGAWRRFRVYFGSPEFIAEQMRPDRLHMGETYPNPFSSQIDIPYSVPQQGQPGSMYLLITDLWGREIRRMALDTQPGFHTARWDGRNGAGEEVAAGTYFCTLLAEGRNIQAVRKMVKQ